MNWHTTKNGNTRIKKLLQMPEKGKYYKGLYVISRDENENKNNELQYKIGMAHGSGGLYKRVQSYEMCYPYKDEFFVHFFIITHTEQDAKDLEKVILDYKSMIHVKRPKDEAKETEYRIVSKKETLHNALLKALKDNSMMWSYIVVLGEKGWKLIKNTVGGQIYDDKRGSGLLAKPSNSFRLRPLPFTTDKCYVEKERLEDYRNTGEIYNETLKADFDINTAKKGHTISDKWTKQGTIVRVSKKGVKGKNPTPYILVTSPEYPEDPKGYKLWIHEPK